MFVHARNLKRGLFVPIRGFTIVAVEKTRKKGTQNYVLFGGYTRYTFPAPYFSTNTVAYAALDLLGLLLFWVVSEA